MVGFFYARALPGDQYWQQRPGITPVEKDPGTQQYSSTRWIIPGPVLASGW